MNPIKKFMNEVNPVRGMIILAFGTMEVIIILALFQLIIKEYGILIFSLFIICMILLGIVFYYWNKVYDEGINNESN